METEPPEYSRRFRFASLRKLLKNETGTRLRVQSGQEELAKALVRQGKSREAFPDARRAVDIFTRLGSPHLEEVRAMLLECETKESG